MPVPLEIAVFSSQDALAAQSLGASRIEFNAPGSYPDGGLTPPIDALTTLSPQLTIPMRVMIRPRGPPGGPNPDAATKSSNPDFIYTPAEFDLMRQAILDIRAAGVMSPDRGDGFVFGILARDSASSTGSSSSKSPLSIDMARCNELIELAKPIPCVFHRAFDPVASSSSDIWKDALDVLIASGFQGLLTAGGGKGSCGDNISRLEELSDYVAGRMEVVAGGGVRHNNALAAAKKLRGTKGRQKVWLHSAALLKDGSGLDEAELQILLDKLGGE